MKEEVIKIIASVAEVPEESINLNTNLIADLDLESLDLVTLVSEIENKYGRIYSCIYNSGWGKRACNV